MSYTERWGGKTMDVGMRASFESKLLQVLLVHVDSCTPGESGVNM